MLVCAYEEEGAIGDVLAKIPDTACGLPLTTLVIVDGGKDRTAEIAEKSGATTIVVPGQPRPRRGPQGGLPVLHRPRRQVDRDDRRRRPERPRRDPRPRSSPLIDDESDFVVASRRLGTDNTTDRTRKSGVVVFSSMMNKMTGAHLTDTSNGYRALRVSMLEDVLDRLEQDQYQTAELLITCLKRGWRVTERPTVWYPRQAGTTKKGANWLFGFRYLNVVLSDVAPGALTLPHASS